MLVMISLCLIISPYVSQQPLSWQLHSQHITATKNYQLETYGRFNSGATILLRILAVDRPPNALILSINSEPVGPLILTKNESGGAFVAIKRVKLSDSNIQSVNITLAIDEGTSLPIASWVTAIDWPIDPR